MVMGPPRELPRWLQVGRLPAGRGPWGSEDLHPVLRADGEQPGHVRRGVERRWQDAFEGGLTDLSQESFEQKRLEADQRSASGGACDERVRHPLGAEGESAGRQGQLRVADVEGELSVEDVEPLVLVGMDVPGGAFAGAHLDLEQAILPAGIFPADLDRLEHAEEPERLAFLRAEPVSELCPLLRYDGHLHFLSFVWYASQLS